MSRTEREVICQWPGCYRMTEAFEEQYLTRRDVYDRVSTVWQYAWDYCEEHASEAQEFVPEFEEERDFAYPMCQRCGTRNHTSVAECEACGADFESATDEEDDSRLYYYWLQGKAKFAPFIVLDSSFGQKLKEEVVYDYEYFAELIWRPCEGCGVNNSSVRLTFVVIASQGFSGELCPTCIETSPYLTDDNKASVRQRIAEDSL